MILDSTRYFSRCLSRGGERLLNMLAVCTGTTTGNVRSSYMIMLMLVFRCWRGWR